MGIDQQLRSFAAKCDIWTPGEAQNLVNRMDRLVVIDEENPNGRPLNVDEQTKLIRLAGSSFNLMPDMRTLQYKTRTTRRPQHTPLNAEVSTAMQQNLRLRLQNKDEV